jgi:deoxycytidylate deaminase
MIINAGITDIISLSGYPDEMTKDLLKESGIRLKFIKK